MTERSELQRAMVDRNQAGQEGPERAPSLIKHLPVSFPCLGVLDDGMALPTLKSPFPGTKMTSPSRVWRARPHIRRKERAAA